MRLGTYRVAAVCPRRADDGQCAARREEASGIEPQCRLSSLASFQVYGSCGSRSFRRRSFLASAQVYGRSRPSPWRCPPSRESRPGCGLSRRGRNVPEWGGLFKILHDPAPAGLSRPAGLTRRATGTTRSRWVDPRARGTTRRRGSSHACDGTTQRGGTTRRGVEIFQRRHENCEKGLTNPHTRAHKAGCTTSRSILPDLNALVRHGTRAGMEVPLEHRGAIVGDRRAVV